MKAGIIFTGTGPILILSSYPSFTDPNFREKLSTKGITKYIAYELPVENVHQKYGKHFQVIMSDLSQSDDLRVLDYNGHHVFKNFTFEEMGQPVYHQ